MSSSLFMAAAKLSYTTAQCVGSRGDVTSAYSLDNNTGLAYGYVVCYSS